MRISLKLFVVLFSTLALIFLPALFACAGSPQSGARSQESQESRTEARATSDDPAALRAEFREYCKELVRCDGQLRSLFSEDPPGNCSNMFLGVQVQMPEELPGLRRCIDSQSCADLNVTKCFVPLSQKMRER